MLADGNLYFPLSDRGVLVTKAEPEFQKIAFNKIATGDSDIKASLAVDGDRLLLRNDSSLYCIGQTTGRKKFVSRTRTVDLEKTIPAVRKFDVVHETGRVKQYNRYLSKDPEEVVKVMLSPYRSVITDEQVQSSRKIVMDRLETFTELRNRKEQVHWDFLSGKNSDRREYFKEMSAIEKATTRHNQKVRMEIKAQFSEQQMAQHLAEAEEWRKKQQQKTKKKTP